MVLKQSHLQSPYHHPFIPPFPFPIIIGYTILLLDRSHHLAIHIIGLAPSSLFWPLGPIIPGFDHQRRHPPSLSAADPSTTICRIRTWSPSLVAVSISASVYILPSLLMATAGKQKKILKPNSTDDNMDTNDVASIIDETIPITIFDDSESELDNMRDQTSKQKEKPKNPPPSRLPHITRTHRTEPSVEEMITDPICNINKASTSSNLQSWERPKYTTDADAKFINTTYKMVNGLAGNLKTEHKRDVLKSLSIAEAMYKEVLILRKRLAESIKRKRDVLEESDIDIMEFDNIDSSATEPTNFKKEINEMKSAISKLTMLVQNNINLASTSTPQRPPAQQQPQKTFSEVIKQHSANQTPIHRTIVSIPGNEDSETTRQVLTTRIVPVNEGINIVDSRKLSKGKVAIDFTSPESLHKFEEKIASTSELTHEPPRIMNPMMIIKGASSRIEKEQLPNMIKPFNHLISDFITKNNLNIENEIQPVYVRPNRKPGLRNFASPSSLTSFIDYCNEHHVDIMIVSEPPIKKQLPNFPSSIVPIFHHTNTNSIVRACVCILNKRLNPMILSDFSSNDFIVCQIGDLIISSVYSNPNCDISDTLHKIDHLMSSSHRSNILIAGDFNSSNRYWYSNFNDIRGDSLLATIIQHNLVVINNCPTPTFNTFRRNRHLTSHIDLTTTSSSLSSSVHNWNVVDNLEISDHRIITFDINFSVPTSPDITTTIKWNTNNVNWDQWSTIINDKFVNNNITCEHIRDINNKFDLDFLVSFVTTTIQQACDTTMRRYNRRRIKRHPWHNDGHLRELLHLQKSLYRRIRRSRDINQRTALIEQHQQSRHQYRQRLQQLKDDHLRQQFRGDNSVNNYYNMCHFLKHHDTLPARTLANSADPPSTVKLLLDYLFPDDNIDDDTQQQKYIRRQVNNWSNIHRNDETPFHPVTDRELINAITKFNNNTSPGFDGLAPIICKQFVANFIDIAVAIYNQCLKLKHVPYLWKISVIRILPKPLKDDYTVPNSYRPIGLISVFARTLERIIERRLRGYLVTNKLISEQQYGFMAGKSTDHALYTIDKSLDESMRKNENTALISLDIRGAFDHAWHPSLIKRMILMKVPPYLIFLLCDYLDDRHILTTFGGMAYCWGQNVKLTFSETKTKLMYMSRRIRSPTYPPVSMNNMAVTPTYGLGPKTAHLLLNCVFLPTITYGCHVWKRAIQYQYMKLELRRTLKPMVQLITKSYSTASFIAITAISNSPPLDLVIEYVANVTIARITGKYRHNDNEIVLDKYCANINELLPPPNIINRQPFPTTNRQIFIKSIKRTLGIGCVFMAFFGDQLITTVTHRLPNHCSILQADLFTIHLAIRWIIDNHLDYSATTIICNNIGALQHVVKKNNKKKSELAESIIRSTNDNIIICWKKVDRNDPIQRKLRKKATVTANNHRRNVSYQSAPLSFVKRQEKINMYNNWSTVYDNDPAGTTIKTLCPHLNDARRFAPYVSFWLSQSLTGHGQFGQFLYRFGFSDDQTCQCGHDIQSVHHLRFDCPLTGRLRYHYSLAISSCVNIIDRTKMEVILYEQIAIMADQLHNSIHQDHHHH
ncbi:hypothetical protein HUG17_8567 [Dermatophagoides farinae]|uniref:Reverse transcriptase domain-containing protein n=1 Tax=Dermatophagoides farinae TaxID=6954 RepID=A0A9D4NZB0_DERFA|nr:hypothetical protein HUG17_8567 [Dermatophagoides farinae]